MVGIRFTRVHTQKRYGPMKEVDVPRDSTYVMTTTIGSKALRLHEDVTFESDGRLGGPCFTSMVL